MKRTSRERTRVLERQAVKRKGKGNLLSTPLRAIRPLCKGLLRAFLAISVLVLVSLSFLYVYHYLLISPYLKLEHVEIKGVEQSMKPQLLALGDLRPGLSLLALNLNVLKRKLEKHPWIRSVQVEREFPDTLVIRAEKQEPWAILSINGLYYVNRFGEVFKKIGASESMDFPVITGMGGKKKMSTNALRSAMKVMEVLRRGERPWSLENLAEIHVEDGKNLILYFEDLSAQIRLTSGDFRKEMTELRRVAAHLKRTGDMVKVKAIDFNYRDGAVVSFREG
ncbi:MAG: FtsQ-type POTRA domain-containing protein [Desulfatiglandaceae bacterium]|jgi:cell division protein FtsQ